MTEIATLAGGCFWCTEAIFAQLKGVEEVTPGYSGGDIPNPSYDQVATGISGHAESVQITFDPGIISFDELLEVFFKLHDPTQLNKQGADIGTQYRSSIFYHTPFQKEVAEKKLSEAQKDYSSKVVTEIVPFKNFYPADPMHKDFYLKRKNALYCMLVIDPKIDKLKKSFPSIVK